MIIEIRFTKVPDDMIHHWLALHLYAELQVRQGADIGPLITESIAGNRRPFCCLKVKGITNRLKVFKRVHIEACCRNDHVATLYN
jgi:hypothetical protein